MTSRWFWCQCVCLLCTFSGFEIFTNENLLSNEFRFTTLKGFHSLFSISFLVLLVYMFLESPNVDLPVTQNAFVWYNETLKCSSWPHVTPTVTEFISTNFLLKSILISGVLFHTLFVIWSAQYIQMLRDGMNVIRNLEFGFSYTIMVILLALIVSIHDVYTLTSLSALCVSLVALAHLMDKNILKRNFDSVWILLCISFTMFLAIWIPLLLQWNKMQTTLNDNADICASDQTTNNIELNCYLNGVPHNYNVERVIVTPIVILTFLWSLLKFCLHIAHIYRSQSLNTECCPVNIYPIFELLHLFLSFTLKVIFIGLFLSLLHSSSIPWSQMPIVGTCDDELAVCPAVVQFVNPEDCTEIPVQPHWGNTTHHRPPPADTCHHRRRRHPGESETTGPPLTHPSGYCDGATTVWDSGSGQCVCPHD